MAEKLPAPRCMHDFELLKRLKDGEPSAFEYLFKQKHARLCSLALKIARDRDAAKDIVQEVFIKLWRNREALNITGSFDAYLKTATVNTALNFIKSNRSVTRVGIPEGLLDPVAGGDELEYRELQLKADNAIKNLPDRTRTVFTLVRSEELSYQEVADILHISIKAVEKEVMKALRLLREDLKEHLKRTLIITLLAQLL